MNKRKLVVRGKQPFSAAFLPFLITMCLSSQVSKTRPRASITFRELQNGFIVLKVTIDKKSDKSVLLDLGSSVPFLLNTKTADELKLKRSIQPIPANISGLSEEVFSPNYWSNVSVRDGKVVLADGLCPIVDLSGISGFLNENIDGISGVQLTSNFSSEVNYDEHSIKFYENSDFKAPAQAIQLNLIHSDSSNLLFVRGGIYSQAFGSEQVTMLLDSGLDGEVALGKKFLTRHPDLIMRGAVKGANAGNRGFSAAFTPVGGIHIGSLDVSVSEALVITGSSSKALREIADVALGAPFLKRFNIVIDRPRSKLYLMPRLSDRGKVFSKDVYVP